MRALSLLALFLLFCAAGELSAGRLKMRCRLLEELTCRLQQTALQMAIEKRTVHDIIARCREGCSAALWAELERRLAEGEPVEAAWEQALITVYRSSAAFAALRQEERDVLLDFGAVFSAQDPTVQRENSGSIQKRLELLTQRAGEASRQKGRLYRTMGALMGAGAVLMIW
ncbi:MAG: stage III sporulation protein AB [Eubacteriales bacterium]|nr:stage III sporulation protein AB [Eubacteriales bacterium]